MIATALVYYLACGDIEAAIYDVDDNCIAVTDLNPQGASLIAWLYTQEPRVVRDETIALYKNRILYKETLYF